MRPLAIGFLLFITTLLIHCKPVTNRTEIQPEAYAVYSAYMDTHHFPKNKPHSDTILLYDSTTIGLHDINPETPWWWVARHGDCCFYDKDTARCQQAHDTAWVPMFAELKRSIHQPNDKIASRLTVSYPIQLLSAEQINQRIKRNDENESIIYVFDLSRIAYNPPKTKALLFSSFYCGGKCGRGELILMEKVNSRWTVIDTVRFWIA